MYLVPFVFCRGNGYFNFLVGRLRDSSSAGQSMTYVSFLGLIIVLWEDGRILNVSKQSCIIVYIPNLCFLLIICNFYVFFMFLLVCVCLCVFVCAPMHDCTVICELW